LVESRLEVSDKNETVYLGTNIFTNGYDTSSGNQGEMRVRIPYVVFLIMGM